MLSLLIPSFYSTMAQLYRLNRLVWVWLVASDRFCKYSLETLYKIHRDATSHKICLLRRFGIQLRLSCAFLLLTHGKREFLFWFMFTSAIHFLSVKRSKVWKIKKKKKKILETRDFLNCQKINCNLKKGCVFISSFSQFKTTAKLTERCFQRSRITSQL